MIKRLCILKRGKTSIMLILLAFLLAFLNFNFVFADSSKYYDKHLEKKFKKGTYFSQVFKKPIDEVTDFKDLDFIAYGFAEPYVTGYINPVKDEKQMVEMVEKAHKNDVAAFISFGGQYAYYDFVAIGNDPLKTDFFVQNTIEFCKKYNFDGVDIDWESPTADDIAACDNLFIAMKKACKENKLYFTAAVSGSYFPDKGVVGLTDGFSDKALKQLDWINIMTYSMENVNSPLSFSENSISYWGKVRKIPKEKMVLGVPFMATPSYKNYDWIVAQNPANALKNHIKGTEDYKPESNYDGYNRIYEKTKVALRDAGGIFSWAINMDSPGKYNLTKRIGDTVKYAESIGVDNFVREISIFLNDEILVYNKDTGKPFYDQNNRTLVPIRATAEKAGFAVNWDQEKQTATIASGNEIIKIPLNSNEITVGDKKVTIDTNAVVVNNRIYIPMRAAFEGLGYNEIHWERYTNSIYVNK